MMRWRRRVADDAGVGLILVIGVSVFVFAIAATAVAIAVNAMAQSHQRQTFETSLAVAEAGVDRTLSEVQGAYSATNSDYPVPAATSTWCPGAEIGFPTSGDGAGGVFSTEDAERTWARSQLEAMVSAGTCVQSGDGGQYVVLKPPSAHVKYGKVYALSAIPSFADATKTRLIKSEYVFMPYKPLHAILTAGDLLLDSSTTVTGAAGAFDDQASVHSNGTISTNGNPTVTGPVTSTDPSSASSNNFTYNVTNWGSSSVETKGAEAIPSVDAGLFYLRASTDDPNAIVDWYDLCTDGTVRPYSSAGPCTAPTTIGTASGSTQVRGWKWDGAHTWIATGNTLSGTYFAYHANVDVGTGNGVIPRFTVVASAEDPTSCSNKEYGNINWDHYDLGQPAYHNLWMMADGDLVTHSNWQAGSMGPPVVSGMFVAGDDIQLETSSAGAVGSVISANQCSSPDPGPIHSSEVKNPSVYFDPNSDAPFSSIITTSLWLDYSGG
ncbi:hypothetical protein Q6348_11350 [Isoptericola sp. b441]|uniref:Flp pilus-assembly TadG-like N-terminal domain-containing protein n=1 Tax=Actinotalea lenta TaxID=3064654 RepID=A0ABT9DA65_9CELL|nr:hypothetical protein [Isoptericola sp. b441]MDO8107793.1 hypothetical protein [Isoptericola sp. b441]